MLEIDGSFLVIFAIVWILVFVLNRVFFTPVKRIRDKRGDALRQDREAAARALDAYGRSVQNVEQSLKAARAQAEQVRDSLSAEALREKGRLLEELNAEYRRTVEKVKEDLQREMVSLRREMDSEVGAISEKIEERLIS
jgi:F0F1-type ATP synthase membrane subunit b/b'